MKHSLIRISSHLIWFHEIHIKYVKRKPLQTMIGKKWIQKGIKFSICYWQSRYFLKKLQNKKQNEKGAYGLRPDRKIVCTSAFNDVFTQHDG